MNTSNYDASRRLSLALALALAAGAANAQNTTSTATDSITLEEIIVTSERIDRSIMNTATSVVVLDAATLEQRGGLDGANELLSRIPNITSGSTSLAPAVRGIDGTGPAAGADAFLAGTRPRLNLQIDGRPASYNEVVFGDAGMWDVRQVEVLRGPQSAMQGRNAIAGTLAVRTKDPTFEREGSLRVLGGNYGNREYAAAFSAPFGSSEEYAFRIAAQRKESESFVNYPPFPGLSDPGQYEATTVRAKLLMAPKSLPGFSTLLTLNYSDLRGPQAESVGLPFEKHTPPPFIMPAFQPRTTSAILASKWELSDSLTFANTFAYTDLNVKRIAPPGTGNIEIEADEFLLEPTVRFTAAGGSLTGLAGVYFFNASQDEFSDLFGGGTFEDKTRTAAIFGEFTYALSSQFDVTLGARYEEETREREGAAAFFAIDLDETYKVFLPKLVLSWHPSDQLTLGVVAGRGYNGGGAGFTYAAPFMPYTFKPEYVRNYEIFARQQLAGGRVTLTANAFFSQYDDIQLPFTLGPLSSVVRNADEAETRGLEVSVRAKLTSRLEAFGGLGVLETEVTKYPGSGIEGNDLSRSPSFTGDFGFSYLHESGFSASLDARYTNAYYSELTNDPRGKTDPYWLANAQLSYRLGYAKIFGYVSNLFDDDTLVYLSAPSWNSATIQRPRTYGIGIQLDL